MVDGVACNRAPRSLKIVVFVCPRKRHKALLGRYGWIVFDVLGNSSTMGTIEL